MSETVQQVMNGRGDGTLVAGLWRQGVRKKLHGNRDAL